MTNYRNKILAATEAIGWIGVFLIMLAYVLLSVGIIEGQSYLYQGIMLFGSGAVAFEAWQKRDKQPMVLNLIFVGIAIAAIIRLFVIS